MDLGLVLITGGAGFIGSSIALELIENGYQVRVLDSMSSQIHGDDYTQSELYMKIIGNVDFIKGSVESRTDWEKALKGVKYVIHLAAETGTGQSMYEIERYTDVNIKGTAIFLDILANTEHSVKKIVVASSRAIYGEGEYHCKQDGTVFPVAREDKYMAMGDFNVKCPVCGENVELLPTTENSKIHPTSMYGFTKQGQEQMCMIMGASLNIPVVAFRYQNVYGPGQSLKNPYTGILSIFSTRIKNNQGINIFEDGKESRDFVYIDDVVDATIAGLENECANFESFNIGTGVATDVLTVANTLVDAYGVSVPIEVTGNFRLGDIRHNFADISKAKSLLNFEPKFSFNEGISEFTSWVNTQTVEKDSYEKSLNEMKEKGLFK